MALSKKFLDALAEEKLQRYRLAALAGLHPATLSFWATGRMSPKDGDLKAIIIGLMLGLKPEECFEKE